MAPRPRNLLRWLLTPPQRSEALTAAVTSWQVGKDRIVPQIATWQTEVWGYYDELGEFAYGVEWLASMISRLRLVASRESPGGDEPAPVDKGPVVDLIDALAGGIGGQAVLMGSIATYLSVPGECYVLGESSSGVNRWQVRSAEEIRRGGKQRSSQTGAQAGVQVIDENATTDKLVWRDLAPDSMVIRAWRPHKRLRHVPDSPARHARTIMRELELVNRRIQAEYLSRLASAGIIVFPNEVQFPARPEFQDEPDPFVKEWVTIASEAIETPGTAASVVPMPIRVPAEYIDKIKHIDFTTRFDEKLLEKRESALRRLATALDLPAEVLLGMGDVNHWTAWQLDEDAIKVHISPLAELICYTWTEGYLRPMLRAMKGNKSLEAANAAAARQADAAFDLLSTWERLDSRQRALVDDYRRIRPTKNGIWVEPNEVLAQRLAGVRAFLAGPSANDPNTYVVWYDPSEISVRPDRSEDAVLLYDRFELNGEALRRETGFGEDDKPEGDELKEQIAKFAARQPTSYSDALVLLGLVEPPPEPPPQQTTSASGGGAAPPGATPAEGPPATRSQPPPPPDQGVPPKAATDDRLTWKCRRCRHEWTTSRLELRGGNGHGYVPKDGCPSCGVKLAPELLVSA